MLCAGCKKLIVQHLGDYCRVCKPVDNKLSRVKESKVVAYCREWADSGIIPLFTRWNKENPDSDKKTCGRPKPDIVYDLGTHIVIVEVDEHQHRWYDHRCEQIRMAKIVDGYRTVPGTIIPLYFIRFNPDAQKVSDVTTKTMFPLRMTALKHLLVAAIASPDYAHRVTISKLFYDIENAAAPASLVQTTRYETLDAFEDWIDETLPLDN
jgi:hypothetical protein